MSKNEPFRAVHLAAHLFVGIIILLGIGLLAPFQPVHAQNTGIVLKATPAYDGYFKYGEWLPVWVEVENQGSDLDGDIRVQVTGSQGSLVFDSPVSLPTGSRKLLPVYVLPNNFSRELTVQLISKGKTVAEQKAAVRPQPNISYFIGLLAPERGALALLSGIHFPGQERPKVLVDLNVSQLPERAEALRSFDLLVLNDTDTSKLTPAQAAALASWVQQGGRMIIGGGAGAAQTLAGLPAEMLPFQLQGTREIKADSLQPLADYAKTALVATNGTFVAARSAARAGASASLHTLIEGPDLPLVQEWPWGTGTLDHVALDLAEAPFNGWPGTLTFWETLIGSSGSFPENMPFDMSARQFRANALISPLSNIPSLDLPSIQGLSILLGIYILIIGPLNYLVLRRLRRLHLAWVTIPILTLAFAGGAFGIGYTLRGNDLILNRIALVEIHPDGDAAVTSYMGLFSPRMQSYQVTVQGENLISPMTGYDQNAFGPNGAPTNASAGEMVFIQGQPSRVKGLSVNQWAMQSFMAEGAWQGFGKITGDLHIQNDVLLGKVRNDSQYPLTDVVVIMQSRFARLGDLAPGAEKSVNLGLSSPQSDRFGPPLSYRLYQEQFNGTQMPRSAELKTNIISSVFENGAFSKMASNFRPPSMGLVSDPSTSGGVIVFGWLDQAPPAVEIANNRLTQKTTALVYTTLDYQLPESGLLTLPPGMVPGKLVKIPPNSGTCAGATSIQMQSGQAEFEYQIPDSLKGFQVNNLKLAFVRDNGNMANVPPVALFNWKDQAWVNILDPIQGTNVIQRPAPYISDSGLVRVQITTQNDTMGCIYIDLGVEAERLSSSQFRPGNGG